MIMDLFPYLSVLLIHLYVPFLFLKSLPILFFILLYFSLLLPFLFRLLSSSSPCFPCSFIYLLPFLSFPLFSPLPLLFSTPLLPFSIPPYWSTTPPLTLILNPIYPTLSILPLPTLLPISIPCHPSPLPPHYLLPKSRGVKTSAPTWTKG